MTKLKESNAEFYLNRFNLSNYKETNTFGIREWYIQLLFRQMIRQDFYSIENIQFAKKAFNAIATYGIIPNNLFDEYQPRISNNIFHRTTARALTKYEINLLFDELALITSNDSLNRPILWDDQAYLVVDLRTSDEQILSDFSEILKAYRHHQKILPESSKHKKLHTGKFNSDVFLTWNKYQILPYIDLRLLADLEGFSFTRVELCNILAEKFPDGIDEDFLRKTIEPLHDALTNPAILSKLRAHLIQQAHSTSK